MKFLKSASLVCALVLCLSAGLAQAKADTVALYTEAVMTGDIPALQTLLAPNYWHIAGNGHIEDKEHFIESIKNKELVVNRLTISNVRTTIIGGATLLTGNGYFKGTVVPAQPEGLMRFTLVVVKNQNRDQVVLFQATPVVASSECKDGNCKIQ
ncbi:MAG: nuclear transport factor 2 family protein [Desulfovibrio sp.]|nr:nuclear transport factor 2 family protein [Desulfovibrio sp.]